MGALIYGSRKVNDVKIGQTGDGGGGLNSGRHPREVIVSDRANSTENGKILVVSMDDG